MKKSLILLLMSLLSTVYVFGQSENVGINTTSPDNSAALHVTYVTTPKGVLVPRMTTAQRGTIPSPANGLLIYNTDNSRFEVYDLPNTTWRGLISTANASSVAWSRTGNAGTTPGTDFLGTTDNTALALYTNNTEKLRLNANGNFGVGTNNPTALLSVGTASQFQVNGTGAINAATGITSSGNITFSGLNANEFVRTTAGGQLSTFLFSQDLSVTNTGNATVTGLQSRSVASTAPTDGQVLKWNNALTQWEPATIAGGGSGNTLDAAYDQGGAGAGRQINVTDGAVQLTGTNAADETLEITNSGNGGALFIENTGTGKTLVVNDEASDTTPFTIDKDGNVGVMTASPSAAFDADSTFKLGKTGTVLHSIIKDTVSFPISAVTAGTRKVITLNNIANAEVGSVVSVTPSDFLDARLVLAYAFVSAYKTIKVVFFNPTATDSGAMASMDYYISIIN